MGVFRQHSLFKTCMERVQLPHCDLCHNTFIEWSRQDAKWCAQCSIHVPASAIDAVAEVRTTGSAAVDSLIESRSPSPASSIESTASTESISASDLEAALGVRMDVDTSNGEQDRDWTGDEFGWMDDD
jgi:hypothetical protein